METSDRHLDGTAEGKESENVGTEDDGIANFLSDAIGTVSDHEVFQGVGDKKTFAEEILEFVTSAFPEDDDYPLPVEDNSATDTEKLCSPVKPEISPCDKSVIERHSKATTPEAKVSKNETVIQSRLKVRFRFPVPGGRKKQTNKPPQVSENKSLAKSEISSPVTATTPKKRTGKSSTKMDMNTQNSKEMENIRLHDQCSKNVPPMCVPCCVILYDILKTEEFFQIATTSKVQKASETSIHLCRISTRKLEHYHKLEADKRQPYQQKFNPSGGNVSNHEPGKTSHKKLKATETEPLAPSSPVPSKKSPKSRKESGPHGTDENVASSPAINKEISEDEVKTNTKSRRKSGAKVPDPVQPKSQSKAHQLLNALYEEGSNSNDDDDDSDDSDSIPAKRKRKTSKREKDKKFEKFEKERHRKLSDIKKEAPGRKRDKSYCRDVPLLSTKPLSRSFRIPKADTPKNKLTKTNDQKSRPTRDPDPARYQTPTENADKLQQIVIQETTPETAIEIACDSQEQESKKNADEMETVEGAHLADDGSCESVGGNTIAPPPLSDVKIGDFTVSVTKLIQKKPNTSFLSFDELISCKVGDEDSVAEKLAWWFSQDKGAKDLSYRILTSVPTPPPSEYGSDSSIGNFSNPELNDCQVNEISSSTQAKSNVNKSERRVDRCPGDPDRVNEYCGRSLLTAQIRSSTDPGSSEKFRNLFHLRAGASYDKKNFQAQCNLCNQLIVGALALARHVRSESHKENLRKLDKHADLPESTTPEKERMKAAGSETSSVKSSSSQKTKMSDNRKIRKDASGAVAEYGTTSNGLKIKIPLDDNAEIESSSKSPERRRGSISGSRRRHSRSRSRSREKRRRRSRSRSPVRILRDPKSHAKRSRSRSPDHGRKHRKSRSPSKMSSSRRSRSLSGERHRRRKSSERSRRKRSTSQSRSPVLPKKGKSNKEFNEKLVLTAEGRWTEEMEKQWTFMEAEEAMFLEQYLDEKRAFETTPESHPSYSNEWTSFWERRYQEVEEAGKDPDTYNYVDEWKEFWAKRLQVLLDEYADAKIVEIKRKYQMDLESLKQLRRVENVMIDIGNHQISGPVPFLIQQGQQPVVLAPDVLTVGSNSSRANSIYDISSGRSSDSVHVVANDPKQPPVSVESFKNLWTAVTGAEATTQPNAPVATSLPQQPDLFVPEFSVNTPFSKPSAASVKSDITVSSSSDGSDYLGFDLVQVLRLLCKTEDQLSFLAPKVLEYYKLAEGYELKSRRGSHVLLDDEMLVTLLFQARDRFMTLIRSNVLSHEVLKVINFAVYALNALLDSPKCQRFRPPPTLSTLDVPAGGSNTRAPANSDLIRPLASMIKKSDTKVDVLISKEMYDLVNPLSSATKDDLASEISKFLVLLGMQHLSNLELRDFVQKLLPPLLKRKKVQNLSTRQDGRGENSRVTDPRSKKTDSLAGSDASSETEPKQLETTILGHDYSHSQEMRIPGVLGIHTRGSALPSLSQWRSGGGGPDNRFPATSNPSDSKSRDTLVPPPHQASRGGSGRRSPFSQREMATNPVAMNPVAERSNRSTY